MFKAGFWSIKNSSDEPIVNDFLIFSNIDSQSHWLLCSTLGYQHQFGRLSVFAGIRDANLDYFISECEAFFTNSSAGTPPTISLNSETGLYPLTGMGIHVDYRGDRFKLENSFYNNVDYVGHNNTFKFEFNPSKYGFVNFTQFQYTAADSGVYTLGSVVDKVPHKNLRSSYYLVAENDLGRYGQTSFRGFATLGLAQPGNTACHTYMGIGAIGSNILKRDDTDKLGLMFAYARMDQGNEVMTELSYSYSFNDHFRVQPTLHYINNTETRALVGIFRGVITFGD